MALIILLNKHKAPKNSLAEQNLKRKWCEIQKTEFISNIIFAARQYLLLRE